MRHLFSRLFRALTPASPPVETAGTLAPFESLEDRRLLSAASLAVTGHTLATPAISTHHSAHGVAAPVKATAIVGTFAGTIQYTGSPLAIPASITILQHRHYTSRIVGVASITGSSSTPFSAGCWMMADGSFSVVYDSPAGQVTFTGKVTPSTAIGSFTSTTGISGTFHLVKQ